MNLWATRPAFQPSHATPWPGRSAPATSEAQGQVGAIQDHGAEAERGVLAGVGVPGQVPRDEAHPPVESRLWAELQIPSGCTRGREAKRETTYSS